MHTRRGALITSAAVVTGVSGCLGFGGDGGGTETDTVDGFEFRNQAEESVTIRVKVTRPLDWTPPGTETRTTDGFVTVFDRAIPVDGMSTRTVNGVFSDGGRFVVSVQIDPPNDSPTSFHEDADNDNRRIDTQEMSLPLQVGIWYVEDSPYYDGSVSQSDNDSYLHILLGDPELPPE